MFKTVGLQKNMKILLADDHPLFREGVRHVLAQLGDAVEIVDAHDYPSLFSLAASHPDLDLALADLNMPGLPGHEGITQFRHRFPGIPLVVLTASESLSDARLALSAGALGFIQKSSPSQVMLGALNRVLNGEVYVPPCLAQGDCAGPTETESAPTPTGTHLTSRQLQVLKLLLQGKPNKVIARELTLSEGTVKIHVAGVFRVLNVTNRVEASIAARQLRLDVDAN